MERMDVMAVSVVASIVQGIGNGCVLMLIDLFLSGSEVSSTTSGL